MTGAVAQTAGAQIRRPAGPRLPYPAEQGRRPLGPVGTRTNSVDRKRAPAPAHASKQRSDLERKIQVVVLEQVAASDDHGVGGFDLLLPFGTGTGKFF